MSLPKNNLPAKLARMWLTRSIRPFVFTCDNDSALDISDCDGLGLYVHIPFCRSICAFCPYCKVRYEKELCGRYIDALLAEIRLVGEQTVGLGPRRRVTSLYFGGGSPALAVERIGEIIGEISRYFEITDGIGIELHPDDVTPETLAALRTAGITRISIGIQSFQNKYQSVLGRRDVDREALRRSLDGAGFDTVSMDLIFALPGQTIEHLKADIDAAFECGANHIAVYPFIDFDFTGSAVPSMGKREKRRLLDALTRYCADKGLRRDSIWTFASEDGASYSSMTRDCYLGFGCSAATLLRQSFKINTFSVDEYIRRVDGGLLPTALTTRFTRRQRMVYWLFWRLYSTRLDPEDFRRFFGVPLRRMYGAEFAFARLLGFARRYDGIYELTARGAFYYHYYENYYTLSYIDKMWGLLKDEPFPGGMEL